MRVIIFAVSCDNEEGCITRGPRSYQLAPNGRSERLCQGAKFLSQARALLT
jgi:hypothetical protein